MPQLLTIHTAESTALRRSVRALESGSGGLIEIAGDPGMGKTHLLGDLAAFAEERGITVLRGRGIEQDRAIEFHPLRQALGEHAFPALGLAAVREVLGEAAADGALLLLDDVHWADEQTALLVEHFTRYPMRAPLLVVAAHRPRQLPPAVRSAFVQGVRAGTVRRIEPAPLTLEESTSLLGETDPARVRDLHVAAEGNPLTLLALAATDDEVPEPYATLLFGERTNLSADETAVVDAIAVLGAPCDTDLVAELTGLTHDQVCGVVGRLMRRDILRGDGATRMRFRHPLLGRVAYQGIDLCPRTQKHRTALAALARRDAPATERAKHVERSIALAGEDDLRVLTDAAQAYLLDQPDRAGQVLLLAQRLARTDADRDSLRLALARALVADGRLQDSRHMLHEIVRAGRNTAARTTAIAECALVECFLGHYVDATSLLLVELARLRSSGEPASLVPLLARRAIVGLFDGELPGDDQVALAARIAERESDRVTRLGALTLGALRAAHTGDVRAATRLLAECTALADEIADTELAAYPDYLTVLGWAEFIVARFADSERHFSRQLTIIRELAPDSMHPIVLMGLAMTYHCLGHLEQASSTAGEAKALATYLGAKHLAQLAAMLESAYLAWTDRANGSRLAVSAAEEAADVQLRRNWWFGTTAALLLATTLELAGETERCTNLVLNVGGGPELPHISPITRPRCFEMLAAAASTKGSGAAQVWADRAAAAADRVGQPNHQAYALLAKGHVLHAMRSYGDAIDRYQQAVKLFSSIGMVGAQIRALLFAAQSAGAGGHAETASRSFLLAKDLARRTGAVVVYENSERGLHRLAPSADSGPPVVDLSALTRREREIACIAGTGKRTREIAEELAVSPRTVDLHLTRIYRKLNVRSRAALVRLLATAATPGHESPQ